MPLFDLVQIFSSSKAKSRLRTRRIRESRQRKRRQMFETLESRRLLAVGDLVNSIYSPNGSSGIFSAVAATEDYLVAGSRGNDSGAPDAGAFLIYDISAGAPTFSGHIANPSPNESDWFGSSLAIAGDYVVVGASRDDTGAVDAGSAYVYDVSSRPPVLTSTINNPSPGAGDQFGYSVAVSGNKIAIGARTDDVPGTSGAGSVYIYDLSGGIASLAASISNPTPESFDYFGESVALFSDTLLVGASGDDTGADSAGSVYVYDLSDATPILDATLNNPEPDSGDAFGSAVSLDANRIIVGADNDDIDPVDRGYYGRVFVYNRSSGGVTLGRSFDYENFGSDSGSFGQSVSLSGDMLVVGAYRDSEGRDWGSAFVFDLTGNSTGPDFEILQPNRTNPDEDGSFAFQTAVAGSRIFVSDPSDEAAGSNAGAIFEFEGLVFNEPPIADAGGAYEVDEQTGSVVLDASGSTDDSEPSASLTYTWDLDGDGVFGETGVDAAQGDEVGISPTFNAVGLDGPLTVVASLTVTDTQGASSTVDFEIFVRTPPAAGDILWLDQFARQGSAFEPA